MKISSWLMAIVLLPLFSTGQQAEDVENGIFKINFIPLSVSYEMRVGQFQTIMLQPEFDFEITFYDDATYTNFSPGLSFQYRYYYNFQQRNEKGKRTVNNSVNFVGAYTKYTIHTNYANFGKDREGYKFMTLGPVWGIQRNYKRHFSLGIILGPAISFYPGKIRPDGIVEITLGFHFGK